MAREGLVSIEGARFFKRNFAGKQMKFNPEGRRNFCVFIDDLDMAHRMKEDGWNVRFLPPRDENESERAFIQVAVNFGFRPPKIVLVTYPYSDPKKPKLTQLEEDEVGMLDWAEIENADLTINPSPWENERGRGIKGYLRTLYVTIYQDELDRKYASDVPSDDSEDGTPWED